MTTPETHHLAAAEHAAKIPPHLAGSLVSLRDMIDTHWPHRDRTSDGGIGDARHQAEGSASDHNPWLLNTVRAYDFDKDGIDAPWLAEQLRLAGHYGDPRLVGGGYVIWDHQITAPDFSHWMPYEGADPHTSHVHVSVTRHSPEFEFGGVWSFLAVRPTPPQRPLPAPAPVHPTGHDATGEGDGFRAHIGDAGPKVQHLEHELNVNYPAYSDLKEDGVFDQEDVAVIAEYSHRKALEADTPIGDRAALAASDGRDVGPRTARAFHHDGLI